ncbi:CbtA family protein [Nocardioides dubius]|uniref:CbtA family protein n=1 Tax=Nocardioides dubius TaxID=317019 RepID=A0ABP4E657_9ACTN
MTARTFLVRGLLAGLIAGLFTFLVAFTVGEPPIDSAISLEEAASAAEAPETVADDAAHEHADEAAHEHGDEAAHEHEHSEAAGGHSHGDEGGGISRDTQKTWGLATATVAIGVALGGIVALVAAAAAGRLGRLRLVGSTALVTALGFVAFALVPFLKYPAAPPAVGSGDTIGERTSYYFMFLLISLAAMVIAVVVAKQIAPRIGGYWAIVASAVGYVVVVAVAAAVMPAVNELGDFPADVLWEFRVSSLLTLAALWGSLGIALTALLARVPQRTAALA